jgi:hypothetical protein
MQPTANRAALVRQFGCLMRCVRGRLMPGVRPLLSVKYNLYSGDELLGYSMLEGHDSSMGIRGGKFYPGENYIKVEHIFRKLFKTLFDEDEARRTSGNYDSFGVTSTQVKELLAQVNALNLRVETEDGRKVGTSRINVEDYSEVLGQEERQLEIIVDDRRTYEEFFG